MAIERAASSSSLIDVLDRVLDKGIVIDAWVRVSVVGIALITIKASVVVASIDTYLKYSGAVGQTVTASRPVLEGKPFDELPEHTTRGSAARRKTAVREKVERPR